MVSRAGRRQCRAPASTELRTAVGQWRVRLLQTIHRNVSAIDPVGARRGDEHDHIRYLLGGAEAAHRKTVTDVILEVPRVGEAVALHPFPSTRIEPGETVFTRIP